MMNDTFMKEKPVLPLILSMTLPMVLSMLVNSLYNIIDSFFVAQISEEAMTALSGLPGSKFHQCCYDSLLYYNDAGFFKNVHFIQDSD